MSDDPHTKPPADMNTCPQALQRQQARLIQEITERGELHLQYLSLLEQQEALLSSIPAYIYIKDPQNNVVLANSLFLKAFDLQRSVLPTALHPETCACGMAQLLEDDPTVLTSHRAVSLEERILEEDSFQKRCFWVSKIPFYSPDGQLQGLVGSFVDITEMKQTQAALEQSEVLFRSLAERSFSAIFILQNDRLIYVNPLFENIFSLPLRSPCQAVDLFAMFTEEDGQKMRKKCRAIQREGLNTSRFLVSAVPQDRISALIFEVYLTQIEYNAQPAVLGSLLDITDKQEAAQTLENKAQELEALNRDLEKKIEIELQHRLKSEQLLLHQSRLAAMGEMIEAIAHQWRQPLTTLSIMIQNLENAFTFNRFDEKQINRFIDESHLHIRRMTENIDQFGRFFSALHPEGPPQSWFSLLSEAILIYTNSFPKPPLFLSIADPLKRLPCTVQINAFKQVLVSLLRLLNRSAPDLDLPDAPISLTADQMGEFIHISLKSQITTPSSAWPSGFEHHAITLNMCKKLIEEHMRGHFEFHNDNKSTLEFTMELPLK
jgi:PAS domain S-box-containing protein